MTLTGLGPVGVGIIGAGNISDTYLDNLNSFPDIDVVIVGDLDVERARLQAAKHAVSEFGTAADVLDHGGVEIVVNLTIPEVHATVSSAAISAGKHVWSEKPIATDRDSARRLLRDAEHAGLRVGVAPDTVLGPGIQSARRAIQRGDIGEPLFAHTIMQSQGPELFHPNPAFLFARGAGPLLDIGPYYFTTLVHIFGAVKAVAAFGMIPRATRSVLVGSAWGERFPVEVPTTIDVLARFEGGQQSHSLFSADSALSRQGVVEICGTEGTISLPDPNRFIGHSMMVRPLRHDGDEQIWLDNPAEGLSVGRGLGVLEMGRGIRTGAPHRANGDVGYHVLDVMLAAEESAENGTFVDIASYAEQPPAMPIEFDPFALTL